MNAAAAPALIDDYKLVSSDGISEVWLVSLSREISDEELDAFLEEIDATIISGGTYGGWEDRAAGSFFVNRDFDPYYAD